MDRLETELLEIAYEHGGSRNAPFLLLLHGWPDDATTWRRVTPHLEAAGFRWAAPWLRGFGETRFKDKATFRDGSAEAMAQDALDLVDTLGVERFGVVGHDWGAGIAYTLAAIAPSRLTGIAAMSRQYGSKGAFKVPPFEQSRAWWYQWFMSVDRGRDAVAEDPIGFARLQWDTWSPSGWYTNEEFAAAARSFVNPDWLPIAFNAYRARWRDEPRDPRYHALRVKVANTATLDVPTLVIQGLEDGTVLPESTENNDRLFTGGHRRLALPGVGHFPTREAAFAVATAIVGHFTAQ